MYLYLAIAVLFIWFVAAIILGLLYFRQTPKAQVRRRIHALITQAEAERAKLSARKQKAEKVEEVIVHKRPSFFQRVVKPILSAIGDKILLLTPAAIRKMLENKIFRAGKQNAWSVKKLSIIWALSTAAGFFISFSIIKEMDFFLTQKLVAVLFGTIAGAYLPFLLLNIKINKRKKLLRRQLPEFLDLLCVSVQAGLSFDGAVAKIVKRYTGILSEEFKHAQDEIKFGMTKQHALTQLAKRCDIEEIYLFTTSVLQAERLGTSMAQTLSLQADNIRERHRQYVKTEAMKAPVKILFPMVFFIFPSIFVVLLFPAMITIIKTLGK